MSHYFIQKQLLGSIRARSIVILLISVISFVAGGGSLHAAPQPAAALESPIPGGPTGPAALDLPSSLDLGYQRSPKIAAQRASLAAAETAQRALDKMLLATLLAPELPTRRRQAALGVTAASAGVDQAQRETAYAITRTYFTVLYAREQERLARSVVDRLAATRDTAKKALDAGARDVTAVDVNRATVYLRLAETRRLQAAQGVKRAIAALREAIGLGPEACLDVQPGSLPEVDARPCRDEIIAAAVNGRGEFIRAALFAEVVGLEVDAQGTSLLKRMETFAAGGDIHAVTVPTELHNGEYRPGAVAPEMPTLLVGSRAERMNRARAFHARALDVVAATRNLVALDAEDAYLRWEEATLQAKEAKEGATTGEALAGDLNKDFTAGLKVKVEEVINAWVLAAQARAQYNEALYHQILALADLERATGGAFCARLTERTASK